MRSASRYSVTPAGGRSFSLRASSSVTTLMRWSISARRGRTRLAERQLGSGTLVSLAEGTRAAHSRPMSCGSTYRQEGATMMLALDAHRRHPQPFTEEELRPYRDAEAPDSQKAVIHRRKVMRAARSTKKRAGLLPAQHFVRWTSISTVTVSLTRLIASTGVILRSLICCLTS